MSRLAPPVAAIIPATTLAVVATPTRLKRPTPATVSVTTTAKRAKPTGTIYTCTECGKTTDHHGNHKRHIVEVHKIGVPCLICGALFYDNEGLIDHVRAAINKGSLVGKTLCNAVDWTSFRADATATAPTKESIYSALADFKAWLSETPEPSEYKRLKVRAHTNADTIDAILRDVWLLVSVAHAHFPGLFSGGFRPAVLVEQKVAERIIDGYRQRAAGGLGASRMGDVTGAMKKIIGYIARRMTQQTLIDLQLSNVGAWHLASTECAQLALTRKRERAYRTTPAGQQLLKSKGQHIEPHELFLVGRTCLERLTAMEDKGTVNTSVRRDYLRHLITAILIYALAPRSQCIQQLTERDVFDSGMTERPRVPSLFPPGHVLNISTTQYLVQLPCEAQKHRKVWYVWLPVALTRHMDYWRATYGKPENDAWLFLSEKGKELGDGAARFTKRVTKSVIGRPITAQRFRHCIETYFRHMNLSEDERNYLRFFTQHTAETVEAIYTNKSQAYAHCSRFQAMMV